MLLHCCLSLYPDDYKNYCDNAKLSGSKCAGIKIVTSITTEQEEDNEHREKIERWMVKREQDRMRVSEKEMKEMKQTEKKLLKEAFKAFCQ